MQIWISFRSSNINLDVYAIQPVIVIISSFAIYKVDQNEHKQMKTETNELFYL